MAPHMLMHNSHHLLYRSPFGAVPVSQAVTLRLSGTLMLTAERTAIRLWREGIGEEIIEMKPAGLQEAGEDFWEATFTVADQPGLVWYYFIIEHREGIRYYGNNIQRLGGPGQMQMETPYSYQITVYKADFSVPEWFCTGIIYQIFPDRFRNGLPGNKVRSPKENSFIYGQWEDEPLYIKDPATGKILRWDFHGGNLEGVIEKLPYLKSLGITILYLNPIFEAASNHRYDTGDYKKIDAMLGTEKTFTELCHKAGAMGIRIILDGVFSHTGSDSRYFNREGRYDTLGAYHSKNSPYYPWYRFTHYPDDYDCWWGIDTMPNVNEMEHSFRKYIIEDEDSVIRRWIGKGAGGWRLDVADELPGSFIRQLRKAMKATDPESVLIGEVWEDASNKVSYGERRSYLQGDELDSVMNYPFRETMIQFFLGRITGIEAVQQLMSLYENYPREHFYSCMNLIGSHDRIRVLTLLGEAPDENSMSISERLHYKLPKKQRELASRRLKAMIAFQMTYPGVPAIYYGDEVGMEGFSDPLNRKTYPWGREDHTLLYWTQQMTALRSGHPVFVKGDLKWLDSGQHHMGLIRTLPGAVGVVLLNRHESKTLKIKEKLPQKPGSPLIDCLSGNPVSVTDALLEINVPPLSTSILLADASTRTESGR